MRIFLFFLVVFTSACTFTQKIKDGEMAYDRKQYSVAINMLTDEFERTDYPELKARKAFLIAESYGEINDVSNAIDWYKEAFDLKYGDKALEQLAYALKKNEQYTEAVRVFQAVQKRIGQNPKIAREISECSNASIWLNEIDQSPFEIEKIAENSAYSDYAPQIYEGSQLVFTSDRKNDKDEQIYKWTGHWFSDLYLVNQFSNEVLAFDENINSEHNDGTATFNSDFTEIIFTRCESKFDDDYCKLMTSTRSGLDWSDPEDMEFMEERINYAHPTLHENDSILFFTAMKEEGFGRYDIYYAERLEKGWSSPQVLSASINTLGNEKFPFIDKDTLYFASDGLPGMGGLDIFKSYVTEDGSWSRVENLKPPFNSGFDDFGLVIDTEKRRNTGELTGYFTSSRTADSQDDIYAFRSVIINKPPPEKEVVVVEEKVLKLYLAIKTSESKYLVDNDPKSGITGKKELSNVSISIKSSKGSKTVNTKDKGFVIEDLLPEDILEIRATKEGYLSTVVDFRPSNIPEEGEKTYTVNLLLEKIFTDHEFLLENIYYDLDKFFIREDAKPSLNELGELLNNNPNVKIQLFSHTDCQGKDNYNIVLSQNRAQAAVDYLVSLGIDKSRMIATGLGETRPAINCYCETCSDAEHQENRRTTFKIMEF